MQKLLIHGDDVEKSRGLYFLEKNKYENPIFLDGESLTYTTLFNSIEGKSLFNEKINIIIEDLFLKNKSINEELKKIIELLDKTEHSNILIWESFQVKKNTLLQLKKFDVKEFSYPKNIFVFLDEIKPGNSKKLLFLFKELLKTEETELIFFMLIRQFRLLLSSTVYSKSLNHIDEFQRLQQWQKSKLISQAKLFSVNELKRLYNLLFELEKRYKTGKVDIPINSGIDFFLSDL